MKVLTCRKWAKKAKKKKYLKLHWKVHDWKKLGGLLYQKFKCTYCQIRQKITRNVLRIIIRFFDCCFTRLFEYFFQGICM